MTKKYNRIFLILAFSLLTVMALVRLGEIDISLATLARVDWLTYFMAFAIFYIGIISRGIRWQHILSTMGWSVGRSYAITLLTAGQFGSAILPARAGDIGRVAMLKQDHQIPIAQGIASITTERALDVFSILILAMIGATFALSDQVPSEVVQLMGVTIGLFTFGLIGLVATPSLEQWLREPTYFIKRLPVPTQGWAWYDKIIDFGFTLIHGVRALGKNPAMLAFVLMESLLIWLYDCLIIYVIMRSIGVNLALMESIFTSMIADLAVAIPLTPSGLGQYEVAFIGLLSLFNVSTSDGSLAALLLRFVILWTFIPVSGLITYAFGFSRIFSSSSEDKRSATL